MKYEVLNDVFFCFKCIVILCGESEPSYPNKSNEFYYFMSVIAIIWFIALSTGTLRYLRYTVEGLQACMHTCIKGDKHILCVSFRGNEMHFLQKVWHCNAYAALFLYF